MAERVATLAQLGLTAKAGREARITGLAVDSRAVRPGYLFAALAGSKSHGADYIPSVLSQGAVAILTDARANEGFHLVVRNILRRRAMTTEQVRDLVSPFELRVA